MHKQRVSGSRQLSTLLIALALVSLLLGTPEIFPSVHAAGLVYVNPPAIALQPIGSVFNVQVQVAGLDPFNGWDIQIQSNPSVVNATSLSIDGNLLAVNDSIQLFQVANCINGNSCHASGDGMGVVHSAAFAIGSQLPLGSSDGLLFTITYKVVGSGTYSSIHVFSAVIADAPNPIPVSVETQDGT